MNLSGINAAMASLYRGEQLNVQMDQDKANVEQTRLKSQFERNALQEQAEQKQAKQQTAQQMTELFQSAEKANNGKAIDASQSAKLYSQEADARVKAGDFDSANALMKLAKEKQGESAEEATAAATRQQEKKENVSSIAYGIAASGKAPTVEETRALTMAAIDAGIPMKDIPHDPIAFATWAQNMKSYSLSGKERLAAQEKATEFRQTNERKVEEDKQRHQENLFKAQEQAMWREGMLSAAKDRMELAKERLAQNPVGGAIERRQDKNIITYSNEGLRGLDLLGHFPAGSTTGVFAHLDNAGTVLSAISTSGGNKITSATQQMAYVASQGLGQELALVSTATSGRSPNNSIIEHYQKMVEPQPGDTEATVMFRFANAADFIKTRLETVEPPPAGSKQRLAYDKVNAALAKFPAASDVMDQANRINAPIDAKTVSKMAQDYTTGLKLVSDLESKPAASPYPPDIQAILDAQKKK